MMTRMEWNDGWKFSKEKLEREIIESRDAGSVLRRGAWEDVSLPHTWNGKDGQDGGEDYYRGTCLYVKTLSLKEAFDGEVYLEFLGANSSADCYVNGNLAAHHDGGYSTWRANLTPYLSAENEIVVAVDNAPNQTVYPQMADFTFYGGLYRGVNLLTAGKKHFDLEYYGSAGVRVVPKVEGEGATVQVEARCVGTEGTERLEYAILDGEHVVAQCVMEAMRDEGGAVTKGVSPSGAAPQDGGRATLNCARMQIPKVHLWNGRKDPHLYTLAVKLVEDGRVLDEREIRFGCRTFFVDSQKGFFLNGEPYPLRGVARHQDWKDIGNALHKEHHERDMELIYEMGATTIRLAHYQHDQYFYDLCDEKGLVVWAEIPYISVHMPEGRENTISQMKELIVQNHHHPSIVVWGLSNEISMRGANNPDLMDNHHVLNDMVHEMDPTRLTTMAVIGSCNMDDEYVHVPDTVSYNLYLGWYEGTIEDNGKFLDRFHEKYPNRPLGMSEYGCEAPLNWHSSKPRQGDYTEEYQAHYHEELIKQVAARPWLWATHVWNMFDFASDARAEGGINGMNCKGLVNFDRSYCKDSYYAYKAWLSDEPFVHICGKRYVNRAEDVTRVTVYSNQPWVELYANDKLAARQEGECFFYFDVPNQGETRLVAKAGMCHDEARICKVDEFYEAYRMKESGDVLNWYEIEEPEGYFSLKDKLKDIMATEEGKECLGSLMARMFGKRPESKNLEGGTAETDVNKAMDVISGMSVKRLLSVMGGRSKEAQIGREGMLELNEKLNKIAKPN
ncbi:MAG: glycoside hydrolase family 2 protein [Ruminococcus sp.]|nr:glycoside hydrolase family 2 protein [Ruminococcus sp.]